ncbi:MAG: DUF4349 domain-containing protein [Spirochaetales bacterium]|nr:DUF4349 domain-containing protein [Spirochaetales bacterium]
MKYFCVLLSALLFFVFMACSEGRFEPMAKSFSQSNDDFYAGDMVEDRALKPGMASELFKGSGLVPGAPDGEGAQLAENNDKLAKELGKEESSKLKDPADTIGDKKIYTGYQKLRVADVEVSKDLIIKKTEELGGYVESLFSTYIVLRVPKASFSDCFEAFLKLGEVLNKSVQTFDVSEYFQDLSLRLDIASRARARLYVLLEKTNDVVERLRILKEINRLSEEIEGITLRLDSLKQLIAYSKITLELVPRLTENTSDTKSSIPFEWIAMIDAFHVSIPKLENVFKIELSADFAVFDEQEYFHAETAQGTVVRAGTVKNFPKGDKGFWVEALYYHLGPYYSKAERQELGKFGGVLFSSKDREPFYYLVALRVFDKKLQVVEVLMPDEKAREKYFNQIATVLKEVK